MITSTHVIIFAEEAEQTRAFFRDVLGLKSVDTGDGWLIFKLPPAELGIHPSGDGPDSGTHELYFMCDDVEATVADLTGKGVEFTTPIHEEGFGLITTLRIPGGGTVGLYQPKHASGCDL